MGVGTTIEYSVFDVQNPLQDRTASRIEQYCDRYVHIVPGTTLKIRDNRVKYKKHIHTEDGIDTFENAAFLNNPDEDPLRSFLTLHRFHELLKTGGLAVAKKRTVYELGDVHACYSELTVRGNQATNLIISARSAQQVQELRRQLGLTQRNLNFSHYLLSYVAPAQ